MSVDLAEKPPSASIERSVESKKKPVSLNGYADFYAKIDVARGTKAAIFTHRCPDPDAIASMMAMQWLLEKTFGIEADLFFAGEISHPQNAVMDNLINPGLKRVGEAYKAEEFGLRILVDTIPENAGTENLRIPFDIVVDHHRDLPHNFTGVVVHKKCGSCVGIIYDMMKHFVLPEEWLDEDVDGDQKLATAMIAGIVTDTEFMMSDDSTELETRAFSELLQFRNVDFLKQIAFFKRPKLWVEKKAEGCRNTTISDEGHAVVGLGILSNKHRDLIADMADEMCRWSGVVTAVAFAVVDGDTLVGCVRSGNASLQIAEFCRKLGEDKGGTGGGKHGKGAYRIPLGGFSIVPDEEDSDVEDAWQSLRTRETKRLVKALQK